MQVLQDRAGKKVGGTDPNAMERAERLLASLDHSDYMASYIYILCKYNYNLISSQDHALILNNDSLLSAVRRAPTTAVHLNEQYGTCPS